MNTLNRPSTEITRWLSFISPVRLGIVLLGVALFASAASFARNSEPLSPEALGKIVFEQKLKQQISLDLEFCDETGRKVKLQEYFGTKPLILVAGYYECPMLCTIVLNGLIETLQDMKWKVGDQFDVIALSINPSEGPALAAAKKRVYARRYGGPRAGRGWHFLTGQQASIRQLADEIGFRYAYDPVSKQYAHPSGFVILTPQGAVSRYFFGVNHVPKELYAALLDASANKTGSAIQQLLFLCFHYNPITGKYGGVIMLVVRVLGAATVLGLIALILAMTRRDRTQIAATANRSGRQDPNAERPAQCL